MSKELDFNKETYTGKSPFYPEDYYTAIAGMSGDFADYYDGYPQVKADWRERSNQHYSDIMADVEREIALKKKTTASGTEP